MISIERHIRRGDFYLSEGTKRHPHFLGLSLAHVDVVWALEKAVVEYTQALMLDWNVYEAHIGLARAFERMSDLRDWGHGGWSESWTSSDYRQRAIEECREAIRLDPEKIDAHLTLAHCLELTNDLSSAVLEYRETIRLSAAQCSKWKSDFNTKEFLAYYHGRLGVVLRKLGQHEEALSEFAWARRLCPDWNPPPE
jgi:tetratricopeptide (TPR) repeat protein